jgi:peptide/nickel transport system substrate-binding protein
VFCAAIAPSAAAAKHPRYGGTLRVELREAAVSFDPRAWKPGSLESATSEKIAALVFDRLVALDNYGRFQPQLAAEWSHDAGAKRWQFHIREGVKFTDDTPLTAADAAAALQPLLPAFLQVSGANNTLILQSTVPVPDLLELLSSGRYFIYRFNANGTFLGTGPFFVVESPSPTASDVRTARYLLKANESCWAGRPFVDAIDVMLGLPAPRRLLDLQLGKADLIEIAPELVRRAAQDNLRLWASSPVITFGLRFDMTQTAAASASLREALYDSLDRATVANVLLQKQAEPTATLLPQWLSGYAFLFDVDTNLDRAKELRSSLPPALASVAAPLRLRLDVPGDLPKLVAERVAVNARQAGLSVQVLARPLHDSSVATTPDSALLHFFAWHTASLSPRMEMDALLKAMAVPGDSSAAPAASDASGLFAREKRVLEDRYLMPIVALPEYVGLGAGVRNWLPSRWGEWHLADVWLEVPAAAAASSAPASSALLSQAAPFASGARP